MKIIIPGDKNLQAILGKQRLPRGGSPLRPSHFVLGFKTPEGRLCLWNELTRRFLVLEGGEEAFFSYFEALDATEAPLAKELPEDLARSPMAAALYEQYFLLPSERQEDRLYEEAFSALKLVAPKTGGFFSYTILSTTCCNARCAYCYEAGMKQIPMEPETAEAIAEYILRSRDPQRELKLVWFGGEPLLGRASIDMITRRLRDNHVDFHSKLVTNGYLITRELILTMKEQWHLQSVQITLDGTEEKYNQIKNYIAPSGSPFRRVLSNIHALLEAGIKVQLRLNVAQGQEEDIEALIRQLAEEFPGEERLSVYPFYIFITDEIRRPYEVPPAEIIAYRQKVNRLQEMMLELGLTDKDWLEKQDQRDIWRLPLSFCWAGSMESTAVIDPLGRLTNCQHCLPEDFYGNVWESRSRQDIWDRLSRPALSETCRHCPFLPSCTAYMDHCPDTFKWCGWQQRQKLQRLLNQKWADYVAKGREEALK